MKKAVLEFDNEKDLEIALSGAKFLNIFDDILKTSRDLQKGYFPIDNPIYYIDTKENKLYTQEEINKMDYEKIKNLKAYYSYADISDMLDSLISQNNLYRIINEFL